MLAGRTQGVGVAHLWVASGLSFGAAVAALAYCRDRTLAWPSPLAWGALLRLVGVAGTPILEDDYWRYLWDGYRFVTAGTPYGPSPAAFFTDMSVPPAMQQVLNGVNNPTLATIYGPVQQALFALAYLIAPARLWPLQAILALADLALIGLLWKLGARGGAWLYALSPLVLKEIAFTGHPDGFGALLLMGALALRLRGQLLACGVLLGLAVATKMFALVLVPFLLRGTGARAWVLFALTLVAVYLPFVAQGADTPTLWIFARDWQFNPALFGLVTLVLPDRAARLAIVGAFTLLCLALWRHGAGADGRAPRGDLLIGGLLAVSPIINPWYLLWVLPFATLYPSRTAWVASFCLLLSYGHPPGDYSLSASIVLAQFVPITAAFLWDLARPLVPVQGAVASAGAALSRDARGIE